MNIREHWFFWMVIACLLIYLDRSADAQVYKWVDDRGRVSYGNVGQPARAVLVEGEVNVVDLRQDIMGRRIQNAGRDLALIRLENDQRYAVTAPAVVQQEPERIFTHSIGQRNVIGKPPRTLQPRPNRDNRRD